MRKLPTLLAGLFLAITLVRVAQFSEGAMQAGPLGWLFSAGLGLAVYTTAYFTRVSLLDRDGVESDKSRIARRSALAGLIAFIVVDGFFNLSEVLRVVTDPSLRIAAVVYGLFPTVAAGSLGYLQGHIDRLPVPPKRYSIGLSLRVMITRWLDSKGPAAPVLDVIQPEPVKAALPAPTVYQCKACGFAASDQDAFKAQRKLAAHMRWSHPKK